MAYLLRWWPGESACGVNLVDTQHCYQLPARSVEESGLALHGPLSLFLQVDWLSIWYYFNCSCTIFVWYMLHSLALITNPSSIYIYILSQVAYPPAAHRLSQVTDEPVLRSEPLPAMSVKGPWPHWTCSRHRAHWRLPWKVWDSLNQQLLQPLRHFYL